MARGLTAEGVDALDKALARHVERGNLPGLVALVARDDDPAATAPAATGRAGLPGGYGWDGGSGTTWRTDRETGLTGILLTQRMATSPDPVELVRDFWAAAYAAAGT